MLDADPLTVLLHNLGAVAVQTAAVPTDDLARDLAEGGASAHQGLLVSLRLTPEAAAQVAAGVDPSLALAAFGPDGKGPYGKPLKGDVLDQIAAKHAAGMAVPDIAAAHGLPVAAVHKAFGLKGITPHAPGATVPKPAADDAAAPGSTAWFDGLTKTGGALGTNPGGSYTDAQGQRWYVKQYADPDHAATEQVANAIYRTLGAAVPDSVLAPDGRLATKWLDHARGTLQQLGLTPARADTVLDHFAADVFLMNWDAVGTGLDNAMVLKDGSIARVDQGGTLLYRAQGARKPASLLHQIGEWDSLVTKNPYYAKVFKTAGVADADALGPRVVQQIDAITTARPVDGWQGFVDRAVPTAPAAFRMQVGAMLEARGAALAQKAATLRSHLNLADVAAYVVPVDDLHITLCYCGSVDEIGAVGVGQAVDAVQGLAAQTPPLRGRTAGADRFDATPQSDGLEPCYLHVEVPGLVAFRHALARALRDVGVPPRATFTYTPHLTIAYVEPGAPSPIVDGTPIPLAFDAVTVSGGDTSVTLPLAGRDEPVRPTVVHLQRLGWCVSCQTPSIDCAARAPGADGTGPSGNAPTGTSSASGVIAAATFVDPLARETVAALHDYRLGWCVTCGVPAPACHDLAAFGPDGKGPYGKPAKGDVLDQIATKHAAGQSPQAIADAHHLPVASVHKALKLKGQQGEKAAKNAAPLPMTPAQIAKAAGLKSATPQWSAALTKAQIAQVEAEAQLQGKTPEAIALEQFGPSGTTAASPEAETKFSEGGSGLAVVHSEHQATTAEMAEGHPVGYAWQEKTTGPQKGKWAYFQDGVQVSAAYPKDEHAAAAKTLHYGTGPQGPIPPSAHASDWPVGPGESRQKGAAYPKAVNAHYASWVSHVTEAQKVSIDAYTGSGYGTLNKQLREGGLTASNQTFATRLTTAIDAAPQPPPPDLVWRGVRVKNFGAGLGTGDVIDLHGFQSTSISPSFADHWASQGTLLEIKPRKGAYVRPLSGLPHEYEFLLPTGDSYRVAGRAQVSLEGHKRDVIQLEQLSAEDAKTYHKKGAA